MMFRGSQQTLGSQLILYCSQGCRFGFRSAQYIAVACSLIAFLDIVFASLHQGTILYSLSSIVLFKHLLGEY